MLKRTIALSTLLLAFGAARSASAAPARPSWCSTAGLERLRGDDHNVEGALKKDDPEWTLYYLVGATCGTDEDVDEHRPELEAARRYWSEKLDMIEADWADVAVWATADQGARYVAGGNIALPFDDRRPWSSFDALDQYRAILGMREDQEYFVDALGPKLSETGRLAYIDACLQDRDAQAVRWATCAPDIALFQPGKVSAEMRGGPQEYGYGRTLVRMKNYMMRQKLEDHAAAVKALEEKDEAYGKLFQIAEATRKEWDGRWQTDAAALALLLSMDEARISKSRKALDGCQEKTWAAWSAAVGKIPASEFEGMTDEVGNWFMTQALGPIIRTPDVYLPSMAMSICEGALDKLGLIPGLSGALTRWPGFRGPRTSAITAMMNAGITLDDREAHLDFPHVSREWFKVSYGTNGGSGKGVIASVKDAGGKLTVVFVTRMEKQTQCAESRTTNRLSRIDSDGRLVYQEKCIKTKVVTFNAASDPQEVDPHFAAGLKPGVYTNILLGIAQGVWASPTATKPSVVLGVPVK